MDRIIQFNLFRSKTDGLWIYNIKIVVVIEHVETVENTVLYGKRLIFAVEKMWTAD